MSTTAQVINWLLSLDPLLLYSVGMTSVALALIAEVQHNTAHDKSDYPADTTKEEELEDDITYL